MDSYCDKQITIKDVARLAGVSVSTVSRAISGRGYISPETNKRIQDVINKYNYFPSSSARTLVTRKSGVIGLLVPFIDSPFFSAFVNGVKTSAAKHGYDILLCYSNDDAEAEQHQLRMLCERRVDGIIAIPVSLESTSYSTIRDHVKIPLVLAMRQLADDSFSTVTANNFKGAYQAVTHLINKGHKDIGFIVGDYLHLSTFAERWEGAKQAMADNGLEINYNWVGYCGRYANSGKGYKAMESILKNGSLPTAIYSDYQMSSIPALLAIKNAGLRVPDDISVCAFDGFEDSYCAGWLPELSANIHPSREMGIMSVEALCSIFKKGGIYHYVIDVLFHDRGTVSTLK